MMLGKSKDYLDMDTKMSKEKYMNQVETLFTSGVVSTILKEFSEYVFTDGQKYITKFGLRVQAEMFIKDALEGLEKIKNDEKTTGNN